MIYVDKLTGAQLTEKHRVMINSKITRLGRNHDQMRFERIEVDPMTPIFQLVIDTNSTEQFARINGSLFARVWNETDRKKSGR